jgi:hypothetical protein
VSVQRRSKGDPNCVSGAGAKLTAGFSAAEKRGGCADQGDQGDVSNSINALVSAIAAELRPAQTASGCAAIKLRAAGRRATRILSANGRNQRTPDAAKLAHAIQSADLAFAKNFALAETRSDCLTTSDEATVKAMLDDNLHVVIGLIVVSCGDGVRAGQEQCDGNDATACSGLCQSDCTCPSPACGNNVIEASEECDGTSLGTCGFGFSPPSCGAPSDALACQCCVAAGQTAQYQTFAPPKCCDGSQCAVFALGECACQPYCVPDNSPCLGVPCCSTGMTCSPGDTC